MVRGRRWGGWLAIALLIGCGGEVVPEDADAGGMDAAVGRDAAAEDAGGDGDDATVDDADVPFDASEARDGGPACTTDEDCTAADRCETARCDAGACVTEPVVCDDGDPCTADACDPETGECVAPRAADGTSCPAGSCCGGACVDDDTDDAHCGGCGIVCGGNASCDGGSCACDAGFADCDSDVGCEASVGTDPSNCGTCGTTCSAPTPSCIDGSCAACATAADCADDGLACTGAATCDAGVCSYPIEAGTCLIGGACYTTGDGDPTDQCRECDPTQSTTAFSVRVGRSCDDGLFCTDPDLCDASGACVGAARACDDALSCTVDACSETMGRCTATPTAGRCAIDGACWVSGEVNPSNPMCEACDPFGDQRAWTPLTGVGCDDGMFCTVGDACDGSGACVGTARSCSDSLACTTDACNETTDACDFPIGSGCLIAGACYATGAPNPLNQCEVCDPTTSTMAWTANSGASCDDGQYCTTADACTSSATCVGMPRDCDDALSCTNDTCNESADACEHGPQADFCVISGSCVANGTRNPSNDCEACIPGTSTSDWSARTGQSCNDSMYCTEPDTCDASGACTGSARSCDDGLSCTADSCSESGDRCDNTLVAGTCRIGGACYGSGDLNPANSCEACDPATSTSSWTARTGASCDDGQYCTVADECNSSGACVGGARDCSDSLSCTADSCDEAADTCRNALSSDACAIDGSCYANGTLDPSNGCQVCDATSDQTAWTPRTGASCDDGQYCTVGDACDSTGACATSPRSCSDGNSCTLDSCDEAADTCENTLTATSCIISGACWAEGAVNPANQCQHCDPTSDPMGWTARTGQSCDDGQFCTVSDTCNASASCLGAARACGDGLSCTTDSCDESADACQSSLDAGACLISGMCVTNGTVNPANACEHCDSSASTNDWSPRTGTACSDGQFCTVGDTCNASGACVGSANGCEDGLSCTSGTCDETTDSCAQTTDSSSCLIDSTCYASGAINPSNPCEACVPSMSRGAWTPRTGESCDDGLFCTVSDACDATGACAGGSTRSCDDGLTCTSDACDEAADACVSTTQSDRCLIGGSCYTSGTVNPLNGCESCDPTADRSDWSPRTGVSCDDGQYCTVSDACTSSGTCAGSSRSCDDSLPCTSDSCDEAADACQHMVAAGTCAIGPACYSDGTRNPSNQCEECASSSDQTDWSVRAGESCDDGMYCTIGDVCDAAGGCGGTGTRSCDDGVSCTSDTCDEAADACDNPVTAGCLIDSSCWGSGNPNPSNPCQVCDPSVSRTTWTADVGASCNDGQYCTVSDSCTSSATCVGSPRSCACSGSCNETADTCEYAGCYIGGTCYADGALHPTSPDCRICDSSANQTGWTARTGNRCNDGSAAGCGTCAGDGSCTTNTTCSDGNPCTRDVCDDSSGSCSYPNRPNNYSCGCAQICCGGTCRSASSDAFCGDCAISCGGTFLSCQGSGCSRGGYACSG